jgi:hypothetical protein
LKFSISSTIVDKSYSQTKTKQKISPDLPNKHKNSKEAGSKYQMLM